MMLRNVMSARLQRPGMVGLLTSVAALLLACLAALGVVAWLVLLGLSGELTLWAAAKAVVVLAFLLVAAAMLGAIGGTMRVLEAHQSMQKDVLAALNGLARANGSRPAGGLDQDRLRRRELLEQVLAELKELNTNLLLTDNQRELKRSHKQWQVAECLAAETEQALEAGDFARSETLLERLHDAVPDDPRYAQLSDRLAELRLHAEAEDIRLQTARAEDLMAVAAYDEAEGVAEDLLAKHPSAAGAIALLDRVRRERNAFRTDQRRRLYAEIQDFAERRQWRAALEAARRLVQDHAESPEAEEVSVTLPTLEANARIAEARLLRDDIRSLLERRRYGEALLAAERILQEFPETQAASELRVQIERLRDLAREARA